MVNRPNTLNLFHWEWSLCLRDILHPLAYARIPASHSFCTQSYSLKGVILERVPVPLGQYVCCQIAWLWSGKHNCSSHSEASRKRCIWQRRMGQVRDMKALTGTHWAREPRLSLLPFQSGDSELSRKNWGLWFIIAFCQLCVHLPSPYLMFSFPAGEGLLLLTDKISLESFTVKSFMKCHCIHVSTRQGASQKGVAGTLLCI